jgi:putative spermidine/putrescine transport system ATP-binding protein
MAELTLENIDKHFGSVVAVRDVNLLLPDGQFVCFLGPSGCGKTTLLRLIAGLEKPSRGRILLDKEDITRVPAHKRNFGMVFQSLALFPHMTVGENIAYSLRLQKVDKNTRQKKNRPVTGTRAIVRVDGSAHNPVVRRTAPACGHGPGAGHRAPIVFAR